MPNDLTPSRLRALIAAARPNTSYCAYCGQPDDKAAQALADYLDGNAPALADALEAKELLEWLCENDGDSARWDLAKSYQYEHPDFLDALRAAKEAAK